MTETSAFMLCANFLQLTDDNIALLMTKDFDHPVSPDQVRRILSGDEDLPTGWLQTLRTYWKNISQGRNRLVKNAKKAGIFATGVGTLNVDLTFPIDRTVAAMAILDMPAETQIYLSNDRGSAVAEQLPGDWQRL